MASRYDPCYARCPPTTVRIQPPPFVLNIPGPALYCPDQPLHIQQHNPCARYPYPLRGGSPRRLTSGFNASSFYSQNVPCYDQDDKSCFECY